MNTLHLHLTIPDHVWAQLLPVLEAGGVTIQTQEKAKLLGNRTPATPADTAGFLHFWAAYPRKVGKGAARKVWNAKACEGIADKIVAAVEDNVKRNEQWHKDGGQYIPHPATWLRQERWCDVLETSTGGSMRPAASVDERVRSIIQGG